MTFRALTAAAACAALLVTCGSDEAERPEIELAEDGPYEPDIDPARFTTTIDNPFMPLAPGTTWVYEAQTEDGTETITVEVTDGQRTVMGVETVVVHDVERLDGEIVEDTYDWFAQDVIGNVWYFGEDTTSFSDDGGRDKHGSWEAGIGGAQPGIVMLAQPAVSDTGYRQEYLAGQAEDIGQVIAVAGTVTTPTGTFNDVVVTKDWTPLEPDVVENKTYARGVGMVLEETVDEAGSDVILVEHTLHHPAQRQHSVEPMRIRGDRQA